MSPGIFFNILLTSAVVCKQKFLHENEIVKYPQNYKYQDVNQGHFRKPLQVSTNVNGHESFKLLGKFSFYCRFQKLVLIMNSITRSLNIIAILTKSRDRKQMFLSIELYIRLTYARSHFQSKYFKNGFLHVQAEYIKIAIMFELLVILFIIKLYARNGTHNIIAIFFCI